MLTDKKTRLEVAIDQRGPCRFIDRPEWRSEKARGIVHHRIESTLPGLRLIDQTRAVPLHAQISRDGDRRPGPCGAEALHEGFGLTGGVAIVDDHAIALSVKVKGDRRADSARGACDENHWRSERHRGCSVGWS